MAQEFRPLVITNGVQKRLPDNDALEIGPGGLVAQNDGSTVKLVIGADDNVDSKPIELLGSAHFKKNVKIEGELQVVGDSTIVDTLVSQTIFEEDVTFGNQPGGVGGDKAHVVGSFDAISLDHDTDHLIKAESTADAAKSELLIDNQGLSALLKVGSNAIGATSNAFAGLELRKSGVSKLYSVTGQNLEILSQSATLDMDGSVVQIDSSGNGHFISQTGTLQFDAVGGQLDMDGNSVTLDSDTTMALAALGNYTLNAASSMETITGGSTENVTADKDVNAANIFLDSAGKVLVTAGDLQLDPQFETNGVGSKDAAVAAEGKFLVRADDKVEMISHGGISGLTNSKDISFRAGVASAVMSTDAANLGLGQMHLSSLKLMQLDSQAAMQLDADAASHFKTSAGDLTVDSQAANLVLHAAQAIQADASSSSWLKTDTGNLNLEANAATSELIVKSGDKVHVEAGAYSGRVTKAQNSGADALLMSAQGKAFLSADGDIEIDSESSVNVFAGAAAAWQTGLVGSFAGNDALIISEDAMGVLADTGIMSFNKELSIFTRADVDASDNFVGTGAIAVQAAAGDVSVQALATLNKADPAVADAARGGNITLTAGMAFNTLKSVRSGGEMVLSAGKDDLGFIQLKAGKRDTDTWAAPNDGEIELRAQNDLRLRAAGDMRMEVGSTKDVILDDSSNSYLEDNEVGHARIRNVKDPTHAQDVVTKKYMEENGGGTVKLIANEALAKGDLVALESTAGEVKKADAASNDYLFGIATHAAAAQGDEILVRMLGKFELAAPHGQTPGAPFYMDASGAASATAPSTEGYSVQRAGLYLDGAYVLMLIGEPVIL